jgi:rhodanese-related sulfurtransferase
MNRQGPKLVDWNVPLPAEVGPGAELMEPARLFVVDVRSAPEYATGHIPNSVNIALRGRFESWVGRMVPWGSKLVLCEARPELEEALQRSALDVRDLGRGSAPACSRLMKAGSTGRQGARSGLRLLRAIRAVDHQ